MSKELKRYKARIFGEMYPIVSDEDESFMIDVIQRVDSLMKEIAEKSNLADTKKIAVLAALKTSEELLLLQEMIRDEKNKTDKIIHFLSSDYINL